MSGERKSHPEIIQELARISSAIGCGFRFVSPNPHLYANPEIKVPTEHASKFKKELDVAGMLYNHTEATLRAMEQLKLSKGRGS